jgi:hypothetical protein
MTRRFAAAGLLVLIALSSITANARPVRIWSMADLTKEADVIVIARPTEVKRSAERFAQDNLNGAVEGVVTSFQVEVVLKGEAADKPLELYHFVWTKADVPVVNGPMLVSFEVKRDGPRHLLFLKKRAGGGYEALSGQMDPIDSCFILSRGMDAPMKGRAE